MRKRSDGRDNLAGYSSLASLSYVASLTTLFQATFSHQYQPFPLFVGYGKIQLLPNKLVQGYMALALALLVLTGLQFYFWGILSPIHYLPLSIP